jgi:hypothetical protein
MRSTRSKRRWITAVPLAAAGALLAASTVAPAHAVNDTFTEESAEATWLVPHQCADGSTVQARLLVDSTRDFTSPETDDPDPTARVQYLAVCPDGTSFRWVGGALPATITSTSDLKTTTPSAQGP